MKSNRPPLFIDTWGWLTLEDSRQQDHAEVRSLRQEYAKRRSGWVTTDYVLAETVTRLFARRPFEEAQLFCSGLFRARDLGFLEVESITTERFQRAYDLRIRFADKPRISFTDLTSMCVMRERGLRHVVTGDSHFLQVGLGFEILP